MTLSNRSARASDNSGPIVTPAPQAEPVKPTVTARDFPLFGDTQTRQMWDTGVLMYFDKKQLVETYMESDEDERQAFLQRVYNGPIEPAEMAQRLISLGMDDLMPDFHRAFPLIPFCKESALITLCSGEFGPLDPLTRRAESALMQEFLMDHSRKTLCEKILRRREAMPVLLRNAPSLCTTPYLEAILRDGGYRLFHSMLSHCSDNESFMEAMRRTGVTHHELLQRV
jgi:hypothetical protein